MVTSPRLLLRSKDPDFVDATSVNLSGIQLQGAKNFLGFCVDAGAPSSVIGRKQLRRICSRRSRQAPVSKTKRRFRFADAVYPALGGVELVFVSTEGVPDIFAPLDIVTADVPALLGLGILDVETLYADTAANRLVKRVVIAEPEEPLRYVDERSVPLIRADSHIYAEMSFPKLMFFSMA